MKKLLALALALVMTMGLATVGANAAYSDFPDTSAVELQEAMKVMNAVGVFTGKDGKLAPKDNLTRAEAAKLIAYLDLGETIAETLPEVEVFPDVPASHWASKYVAYCADAGIIQGSDGKFLPDDPLSGYAFGAYLLAVLGYDRNIEGMTGADWQIATAKLMSSNGIATNVEKAGAATLDREEAAQYCLNALKATTVDYESKGVNVTMSDGSSVVIGASKAEAVLDTSSVAGVGYSFTIGTSKTGNDTGGTLRDTIELGEKLYKGDLKLDTDNVDGREGESWEYKNEDVTDFVVTDTVLLTYTKRFADKAAFRNAITRTNSKYIGVQLEVNATTPTEYDVDYYLNGAQITGTTNENKTIETFTIPDEALTPLDDYGVVTEFIDTDDNGRADTVNIILKNVAIVTADPTVTTNATTGKTTVTIPALGVSAVDSSKVTGYEDLKKDDVVLYARLDSGAYIIEKAEKISGTVTGNGAKGAIIGSTAYMGSSLTGAAKNYITGGITDTATYDFYLDNGGNIFRAVQTSEATSNYAAIAKLAWVNPAGGSTGAIGESVKQYAQAKLVFTDGSSEIVKVATFDGYKPVSVTGATTTLDAVDSNIASSDYYDYEGTLSTARAITKTTAHAGTQATAGANNITIGAGDVNKFLVVWKANPAAAGAEIRSKYLLLSSADQVAGMQGIYPEQSFVTYTKNSDGTYALKSTPVTGDTFTTLNTSGTAVTNGTAAFDGGALVGNAKTVFVYRTTSSGSDVFTVYTGIANIPSLNAKPANATAGINAAVTKNGIAKYVYIDATSGVLSTSNTDVVFVSAGTKVAATGSTTYYTYQGVVNGEVKTIESTTDLTTTGFYATSVKTDANGRYDLSGGASVKVGIKSTEGNVLVLGTGESYSYKTGAPAYVIETDSNGIPSVTATTIEALVLDATDSVEVTTTGGGSEATTAYVYKRNAAPTTIIIDKKSGSGMVTGGTATGNVANGTVSFTGAAAGDVIRVAGSTTPANIAAINGNTFVSSITISGKNTAGVGTGTTANVATDVEYTLVAGDINSSLTITVIVTDKFSGANEVFTYNVAVS